ncbi:MAG: hypothetical protein IKU39_02975 [Lachnospiraceae bacterium]|nr:hypothetical protein [Lachnospiraceae bacterium]
MKQNFKNILLIINIILLLVCLMQINDLKMEISNLKSNTGSQLSNILTNVNNSYSYIEETLAKEASIVSKVEWEFGKLDIKARTVEVKAYVIPKEYQPDVTQAFFLCNDEEVAAEYKDGKYEVTMDVPLFEEVDIASVLFKENGTIRAEGLNWVFNPRNELLPFVHAYNYGSYSYGKSKDKENMGTWTFSGDLEVDVAAKYIDEFEIEKAEIIRYIDGKEAERMDITLEAMVAHNTFAYNWNPTYEIPYGSKQDIFVEVTMRCGLVYRSQISSCGMDAQGNPIEDNEYVGSMEASIYDTDGNLLYSVDEEMYR